MGALPDTYYLITTSLILLTVISCNFLVDVYVASHNESSNRHDNLETKGYQFAKADFEIGILSISCSYSTATLGSSENNKVSAT
jgi:hypothetical protein